MFSGCRSERRIFAIALAALSLPAVAAPSGSFASESLTPQDRAATRADLEARYAYEQVLVANAPAFLASAQARASSLRRECAGVAAGAQQAAAGATVESPSRSRSAKQTGESNRELRQRSDLDGELALALELPLVEPERRAALVYAHIVSSLRWSNDVVTALEHTTAATLEWLLGRGRPGVCADLEAWAASDYKTLSPATKTLIGEREAAIRPLLSVLQARRASALDSILPYESPREKALAKRLQRLERERESAVAKLGKLETELQDALGLSSPAEAEALGKSPKHSLEIGHGRTAAGTSYTVSVERKQTGSGADAGRCRRLNVEIDESGPGEDSSEVSEIGGSSSEVCVSRSHPEPPSVRCSHFEGVLTIEAQTLPAARSVRLRLSDGRELTSRVALIPAKLGGPAGFYYPVVPGSSAIPVSLTEVGAHGRALRTVELHTAKCTKQSLTPLPGGIRTIASGSAPQGPSFSIIGERYSLLGKANFELRVEVSVEAEASGLVSALGASGAVGLGSHSAKPSPFEPQIKAGCQPHEYAILYGILKAPEDTVLAGSAGSLAPLRLARIPASLHARGVLAYIALPSVPNELLVRTPTGRTVFADKLAGRAQEAREICEGEAEGPAPAS